jgi:hypothetical protein
MSLCCVVCLCVLLRLFVAAFLVLVGSSHEYRAVSREDGDGVIEHENNSLDPRSRFSADW